VTSVYTVAPYLRVHADAPARSGRSLAWQDDTPCQQVDPDLHFPEQGGTAEPAKAICRGCTVRLDCLRYALGRCDDGIWGGFTERERRVIGRRHGDGAPLEDIIAAADARHYAKTERRTRRGETKATEAKRLHDLGLGLCAIAAQLHADSRSVHRWLEGVTGPARTDQPQRIAA
jgi:WhiB family redox-sensing transcriptional regulator